MDRDRDRRRDRDRDRDMSRDRKRGRERSRERSRDRDRKAGRSRDRESKRKSSRDRDESRGRSEKRSSKKSERRDHSKSEKKKKKKSKKSKKDQKRKRSASSSSASSSSSSSSSSSACSSGSVKLQTKLYKQRLKLAEDRKKQKELMKLKETPEEKRLRRLKKKEAKEKKRKERMGWDNDYLHYTNTDNPFGDAQLLQPFVWGKKLEKEGLLEVTRDELDIRNRQKQEENRRELEKVKKRRQERELQRKQREEEAALQQRGKEAAQLELWHKQEDQFHLKQARLRSSIRIQDGRAKPIDLLAKYIGAEDEVDAIEMHEPYKYLRGLQVKDLEDLTVDIKVYKELEHGKNLDYWNDITIIVEDELQKLRKLQQTDYQVAIGRREGINESVAAEVTSIFKGKTASQLEQLQTQIENKIKSKVEGLDIGYWESLLSQLKAHQARARLRDRHRENLKKKLNILIAEQGVVNNENESNNSKEEAAEDEEPGTSAADANESQPEVEYAEAGSYSPVYIAPSDLEPGTLITLEDDDIQRLEFARNQVINTGRKVQSVLSAEEQAMRREVSKNMDSDEAQFSVESTLEHQVYLWSDKYRPRKPRYFNRVHTGFEWNKYNQTHYDMDNPPPKIVQGYKFNIFYPDLIDKNTTPEYFLTPCGDNRDFAILRFKAGPPYEDIAFKIVNREWEYSYKRGFRCQFHNNIFQLWFHFKRYRYRR